MPYIRFLDGLRCLSILWVILLHMNLFDSGLLAFISGHGWLGVDIFFVISGFLITSLLLAEQEATGAISIRNFYFRRAFRIWPIYYLVVIKFLIVAWMTYPSADAQRTLDTIVWPALYMTNIRVAATGSEDIVFLSSWSLALEEQFYLLWPLVLLTGQRMALKIGIASIVACTLWRGWVTLHSPLQLPESVPAMIRLFYAPDTRMDVILYGAVLALILSNKEYLQRVTIIYRQAFFLPLMISAFLILMWKTNRWEGWFGSALGYGMTAFVLANILGCLLVARPAPLIKLLEASPMVYVGKISYGMYLFHGTVITFVMLLIPEKNTAFLKVMFMGSVYVGSIAVAGFSYKYLETPFLQLKKKFEPMRIKVLPQHAASS